MTLYTRPRMLHNHAKHPKHAKSRTCNFIPFCIFPTFRPLCSCVFKAPTKWWHKSKNDAKNDDSVISMNVHINRVNGWPKNTQNPWKNTQKQWKCHVSDKNNEHILKVGFGHILTTALALVVSAVSYSVQAQLLNQNRQKVGTDFGVVCTVCCNMCYIMCVHGFTGKVDLKA